MFCAQATPLITFLKHCSSDFKSACVRKVLAGLLATDSYVLVFVDELSTSCPSSPQQ